MSVEQLRPLLQTLTAEGLSAIESSSFAVDGCKHAIAWFDSEKDQLILDCPSYTAAAEAMATDERVITLYGGNEANRLVLQFVFNACGRFSATRDKAEAFEETLARFATEYETDHWTFRAVANVQNCETDELPADLGDGVSLRARSFEELGRLLNWGQGQLNRLGEDWRSGGGGSNILMVEVQAKKTPANFLLEDDGSQLLRAARALLAMRLVRPGDIRIGRMFAARPAVFNVGLGGLLSYGFSHWHPGPAYKLEAQDLPKIAQVYRDLLKLDTQPAKVHRNLRLALRSFGAIYDRLMHQLDDRVVDAITALEALWKLDQELSFRLAFRTASLLAHTDDERIALFSQLTNSYRIRSKIVHGGTLSDDQERELRLDEPLREIVRQCIRGFLHLAVNPGDWTLARVEKEADTALLHHVACKNLQEAMRL